MFFSGRSSICPLSRNPPAVRRLLGQEVGFGCPVPDCGNPYLTYHHFDPPWHVREHNEPKGMIALCREHHDKAAAWSVEELRNMKASPQQKTIEGRFEWMKRRVLTIAGGGFFFENKLDTMSRSAGRLVWYNRDEEGRMLLNLRMIRTPGSGTVTLENNDWTINGTPDDVESPPNGSYLRVKFASGDDLQIRFTEHADAQRLIAKYGISQETLLNVCGPFPFVTAEVSMKFAASGYELTPKEQRCRECRSWGV